MPLHVPGYGDLEVDIAYGGCYYVLADAAQLDLPLTRDRAREVVDAGTAIFRAASDAIAVRHPEVPEIDFISYAMLTGDDDPAAGRLRGATVPQRACRPLAVRHGQLGAPRMHGGARSGRRRQSLRRHVADRQRVHRRADRTDARSAVDPRCSRASRVAAGWSARGSPRSIRPIRTRRDTCFRTCGAAILPRRQGSACEVPETWVSSPIHGQE